MEWLESGRIRADDVYLQLLGKESCLGALEDKSLALQRRANRWLLCGVLGITPEP